MRPELRSRGDVRPDVVPAARGRRWRPVLGTAGVGLLVALVATGVTLAVLQFESRTNTQQVNLRSGVTITEDSAIVQAAAKARPAVVTIVTQSEPAVVSGSGFLATSDGYIVTNISVIARASQMTVLVVGDPRPHAARLIDYDCQTGVAVIKIDQVSGLPTLAFADPTALVQGQVLVAVAGPLTGSAVTRGIVSALHRPATVPATAPGASPADRGQEFSDTIQTDPVLQPAANGAPILNVGGQVIGIVMAGQGTPSGTGFGLSTAGVQDDVQQILQTGQLVVPSIGATGVDLTQQMAALGGLPEGSRLVTVDKTGPAAAAGLEPGDVITQLDDVNLDAAHPLRVVLRSRFHPNQRVTVTYTRGTTSIQVQLTLAGVHPSC